MAKTFCATCRLRRRYDAKPHSLLGRLWLWHTAWCPGWRSYLASLPEAERQRLAEQYGREK